MNHHQTHQRACALLVAALRGGEDDMTELLRDLRVRDAREVAKEVARLWAAMTDAWAGRRDIPTEVVRDEVTDFLGRHLREHIARGEKP